MSNPKIAIGGVVRNRAWVLPDYLTALNAIVYDNLTYLFLENDSEDDSNGILDNFTYSHDHTIKRVSTGSGEWDRGDYSANQYANLAAVRNAFLEAFMSVYGDADYLLSVDSDIIVPPDIVTALLEHADQNTIVAAAISNIPGQTLNGQTPGNFMLTSSDGLISHPNPYPTEGLIDVDVTGAVYLIPRKAIADTFIRYGQHAQGEDIPFCLAAKEKGYALKILMNLVCEHRMIKP